MHAQSHMLVLLHATKIFGSEKFLGHKNLSEAEGAMANMLLWQNLGSALVKDLGLKNKSKL